MDKTRIVIVGAGFGGLSAARALRRERDVEVTLVDRTNHHLFQPLLYQVASAALNPSEIASAIRAVLRNQENTTILMAQMTGVDYEARTVDLDHGAQVLPYDYLVLAMGGRTSYFGKDEWSRWAPGLKSLPDALAIRNKVLWAFEQAERETDPEVVRRLMTFVVVGGGPTGVEMAGAFAELRRHVLRWDFRHIDPNQARVILIEAGDALLGGFPPDLGRRALERLVELGVDVRLNTRVKDVGRCRVDLGDSVLEAETVIWGAGVGGHELAPQLGEARDRAGRLMIDPDLRLPGHERVFCIGDMSHFEHGVTNDGKPLPGLAPVAMQQGQWAVRNILRHRKGEPLEPFRYWNKGSMATIGRSAAVAQVGRFHFSGFMAWLAWLFVHLMSLVTFQMRLIVLLRWAWAYFTWKWGVRLITDVPEPPDLEGPPPASRPPASAVQDDREPLCSPLGSEDGGKEPVGTSAPADGREWSEPPPGDG